MAGFKATHAVSNLSYDFTGLDVDDEAAADLLAKAKGTTPEPSSRQVRHMQSRQRALLGLPIDSDPLEINKALAEKSEDWWHDLDEDVIDIIADVTTGRPSREELAALPFRVREAYVGWILGELNSPTTGTSGRSRPSLAPVKNA